MSYQVAFNTENKILNTTGFITISEFNRLTKINFDSIIKKVTKSFASKSQVYVALDTANKMFILSYFDGKVYFNDNGPQYNLVFQLFSKSFATPTGSDRVLT